MDESPRKIKNFLEKTRPDSITHPEKKEILEKSRATTK